MRLRPTVQAAFSVFALLQACACGLAQQPPADAVTSVASADAACGQCHADILHNYLNTPMGNASGRAMDHAISGSSYHAASKVTYGFSAEDKSFWLTYAGGGSQTRRKLDYFMGSGHLGVTYLYGSNGYLLESPAAYYANLQAYDMKPGLGASTRVPEALPMSTGCMRCHMSDVQRSDPGTDNHFQGLPFLHGGITCERCHGDTREHVRTAGKAAVINPIRLDADRRDSICISCHLEGDVSVEHRGRAIADFKPGERIEDYISYFVYASAAAGDRGVSEIEQLSLSKCKRSSGDRMSCMSCHDPHYSPSAAEQSSFYRSKCLACHTGAKFTATHYPATPDCTSCHMPTNKAQNIPHVAWTDHRIRQHPAQLERLDGLSTNPELVPLLGQDAPARDLALAYYNLTADGKISEAARAGRTLLAVQKSDPPDAAVLTALGFLAPAMGKTAAQSADYYRDALQLDPLNLLAANNLATLLARAGQLKEAADLWQSTFARNEDIESLGINLALAECKIGEKDEAVKVLQRVLVYGPNSPTAHRRLQAIESGQETCSTPATPKPAE
jgi:predicted CXXCH cytochrome family protein